ncbi:hypothetical protein QUE96_00790 [Lactococcus lactis]|uniref:hypothetical protein n=1 Tax=Lactococcus lactis TaxID=1358 RepID=UPI0025A199AF|nr:hypothetical protein [Lactococcus lactis]MDM7655211.1 hypothetical protein [Lactococcus lactis]
MTISEIIKDWEMSNYPLGRIKKEKLMLKTKDEIISILDSMASWKSLKGIAYVNPID